MVRCRRPVLCLRPPFRQDESVPRQIWRCSPVVEAVFFTPSPRDVPLYEYFGYCPGNDMNLSLFLLLPPWSVAGRPFGPRFSCSRQLPFYEASKLLFLRIWPRNLSFCGNGRLRFCDRLLRCFPRSEKNAAPRPSCINREHNFSSFSRSPVGLHFPLFPAPSSCHVVPFVESSGPGRTRIPRCFCGFSVRGPWIESWTRLPFQVLILRETAGTRLAVSSHAKVNFPGPYGLIWTAPLPVPIVEIAISIFTEPARRLPLGSFLYGWSSFFAPALGRLGKSVFSVFPVSSLFVWWGVV